MIPKMAPTSTFMVQNNFDEPISRTYQYRKVMKPMLERKRRARINRCLDELKDLMVAALQAEGENVAKLEKADILELTVKHLHNLKRQQTIPEQTYADRFRAGFTHCAAEVSHFLTTPKDRIDPAASAKLLHHLNSCIRRLESGLNQNMNNQQMNQQQMNHPQINHSQINYQQINHLSPQVPHNTPMKRLSPQLLHPMEQFTNYQNKSFIHQQNLIKPIHQQNLSNPIKLQNSPIHLQNTSHMQNSSFLQSTSPINLHSSSSANLQSLSPINLQSSLPINLQNSSSAINLQNTPLHYETHPVRIIVPKSERFSPQTKIDNCESSIVWRPW